MESYTVLARKYRPKTFDEIVGQAHVSQTLRNAIRDGRVGHAYLFSGPRGVGKTTTARIFAKALNCAKGPTETPCLKCESCALIHDGADQDVIEIDAASNRMVEDMRALRDAAKYTPLRSRFKIYVVDEAHMLTRESFNTLLKILEEPPPHVKFIFATTEPHKVPDTILSRCQRFDFGRILLKEIAARLKNICDEEKLAIREDSLTAVARAARGSVRDAESLLDQLIAFKREKFQPDDVHRLVGAASGEIVAALFSHVARQSPAEILETTDRVFSGGVDAQAFCDQLIEFARTLLVCKVCGRDSALLEVSDGERESIAKASEPFSIESLLYFLQILMEARRRIREGLEPRIVCEISFLKMARVGDLASVGELLKRIEGNRRPPSPAPVARETRPVQPEKKRAPEESRSEPVAEHDDLTVGLIAGLWNKVIDAVKQDVAPIWGSVLHEARPTRLENRVLEVEVSDRLEAVAGAEARKIEGAVARAVEKLLKHRIGVKLSFAKSSDPRESPELKTLLDVFKGSQIVGLEGEHGR